MIVDVIEYLENKYVYGGVAKTKITEAQKSLNLKFSDDYVKYLEKYGAVTYENHELTGICDELRLNVIDVTKWNRDNHSQIPESFYVVEELPIDSHVIWQDENGFVYMTIYDSEPKKIFESLEDYILNFDKTEE